jgi:hypothetical protein
MAAQKLAMAAVTAAKAVNRNVAHLSTVVVAEQVAMPETVVEVDTVLVQVASRLVNLLLLVLAAVEQAVKAVLTHAVAALITYT